MFSLIRKYPIEDVDLYSRSRNYLCNGGVCNPACSRDVVCQSVNIFSNSTIKSFILATFYPSRSQTKLPVAFSFKKLSDFAPFFPNSVRLGNRTYRTWMMRLGNRTYRAWSENYMSLTRLLKRLQCTIFYDQGLLVIYSVPVGIEREFAKHCVKVHDIRQCVPNRD